MRAGDKLFHLLDHGFHSALDLFQEVVCPLLGSFRSPAPEDLVCSLDIHGNDLGVQEGDVWMQEVRQQFLWCQQFAVGVSKSEDNADDHNIRDALAELSTYPCSSP